MPKAALLEEAISPKHLVGNEVDASLEAFSVPELLTENLMSFICVEPTLELSYLQYLISLVYGIAVT